jgi:hypothetical protein
LCKKRTVSLTLGGGENKRGETWTTPSPATLFSFVLPSNDHRPLAIGDMHFSAAVAGHDETGWKGSGIRSWRYCFLGLVLREKRGRIFIINAESVPLFWAWRVYCIGFSGYANGVFPCCIKVHAHPNRIAHEHRIRNKSHQKPKGEKRRNDLIIYSPEVSGHQNCSPSITHIHLEILMSYAAIVLGNKLPCTVISLLTSEVGIGKRLA